jgi:RimJ/RimL family protein N-acetyltransferase
MIECTPSQFPLALPFLGGIKQSVLPHAVIQGINPGRIYLDDLTSPGAAVVWLPSGYIFLGGDIESKGIESDLAELLEKQLVPESHALGNRGFVLTVDSERWEPRLDAVLNERSLVKIYRRPFRFNLLRFQKWRDWKERLPEGFSIQRIDAGLAKQPDLQAEIRSTWGNPEDFLRHGFGFAALRGSELASYCHTVFVCQNAVEVSVRTLQDHWRQGLASLVTAAFLEYCLQIDKRPNWECWWDNQPSIALGGRLGFDALEEYPVYYWEE